MKINMLPSQEEPKGNIIPSLKPEYLKKQTQNSIQSDKGESPEATPPIVKDEKALQEDMLSQKYADWAKKEKAYRAKIQASEAALKQREEALKAKETEYGSDYVRKSDIPKLFQKDSAQALRDLGLQGDTLTQALLNQPSPQDLQIQELKAEVEALKGGIDQTKNLFSERDKLAEEQALSQIRFDAQALTDTDPSFALIKATETSEEIADRVKSHFEKTGHLLTIEEAAATYEKELLEAFMKYAQLPKVQEELKKLIPEAKEPAPAQTVPPQTKTLAHSQVSTGQKPLTARDRAILAFEGKLT